MNILFFDDKSFEHLFPLTFTKPIVELRIGILKIREKWERIFEDATFSHLTKTYLSEKFPAREKESNLAIAGSLIPGDGIAEAIALLQENELLVKNDRIMAASTGKEGLKMLTGNNIHTFKKKEFQGEVTFLDHPWQIFRMNGDEINRDFERLTRGRKSQTLSDTNRIIGDHIFVEEGVKAECAIINTTSGPVYLGKDSEIMEGSVIRGPFALCEHSVLKLSAKIYGPTTIGPYSKVGGEVNNSVIQAYTNKAHDGFLGNSVIGEWCNLGADTNNSNLKNNYAEVRLWSYPEERFINTGLQFCGLIMGDHTKCGINTMFNTGTVVGVNANIFGSGFPRNFVPSFSWGGAHGFTTYSIARAFEVAHTVMERRGVNFDETEQKILKEVFKMTEKYRK